MNKLFALTSLLALAACGPAITVPEPNWTSVRDDVETREAQMLE